MIDVFVRGFSFHLVQSSTEIYRPKPTSVETILTMHQDSRRLAVRKSQIAVYVLSGRSLPRIIKLRPTVH